MSNPPHFTEDDWDRIRRDWTAWWNHGLDRPMVVIYRLGGYDVDPKDLPDVVRHTVQFPLSVPAEEVIDYYSRIIQQTQFYGDAFPRWYPVFGPGFMATFLGAKVTIQSNSSWFSAEKTYPIEELQPQYDPSNPWWRRVLELTQTAVARWGDQVTVGFVDLGGNLDIFASLHTTNQLLHELYDAPEEVARVAGEITRLWLQYYDELYEIIQPAGCGTTPWTQMWAPGRFYMLQSDFSYMISPKMFAHFVMPDLEACCEALDHPFYHLDGKGQIRHLNHLLSLDRLAGIQWIPGAGAPPPEEWLPLLQRIRARGKLCQVYVTPEGARTITRELGGKGFCFIIQEGIKTDQIPGFLQTLAQEER